MHVVIELTNIVTAAIYYFHFHIFDDQNSTNSNHKEEEIDLFKLFNIIIMVFRSSVYLFMICRFFFTYFDFLRAKRKFMNDNLIVWKLRDTMVRK
jgi:hypothetical protein